MPTYDYKCNACDHRFEAFQPMTAKALKKCPACGKLSLQRLIGTGAGIIFKGSGFYQTDYRSESYKKAASAEAAPATSSSSGTTEGSGKGAAKPADSGGGSSGSTGSTGSTSSSNGKAAKTKPAAEK